MKNGWKYTPLGEIVEIKTGKTPSRRISSYFEGTIPWVKTTEVVDSIILDTAEKLTTDGVESCNNPVFPKDTVLLALYGQGATRGRTAKLGIPAATNQACAALLPSQFVETNYLWHFLRAQYNALRELSRGGNQPNLNLQIVRNFQIPLPPISEQKRIADILDKADAIRRNRQVAIDDLLSIPGSAFHSMFGTPAHNTKGWKIGTIRDLLDEVKYGSSSKAGAEGKYPMLRMNNITYEGTWDLSDLKYIDLPEKELSKYLAKKGDILFNRTNSKDLVGKTAVFQEETPMVFAGYLVRARTNELAHPDYIAGYLNSPHGKATLRHMCKNIVGMANINAQEFQDIAIPHPPIAAQLEYVQLLDGVRQAEAPLREALREAEKLFNSLVQRAFKGEL